MTSHWLRLKLLLTAVTLTSLTAAAQNTGNPNPGTSQPEGVERGGYVIHQSVELGYRVNDVTGRHPV